MRMIYNENKSNLRFLATGNQSKKVMENNYSYWNDFMAVL